MKGMGKGNWLCSRRVSQEGQGRASRPHARCPFGRNLGSNLGREWIKNGQKTNDGSFAAARWWVCFVCLPLDGRGQTIWGPVLELA